MASLQDDGETSDKEGENYRGLLPVDTGEDTEGGGVGRRSGKKEGEGRSRGGSRCNQHRGEGSGTRCTDVYRKPEEGEEGHLAPWRQTLQPFSVNQRSCKRGDQQTDENPGCGGIDHLAESDPQADDKTLVKGTLRSLSGRVAVAGG